MRAAATSRADVGGVVPAPRRAGPAPRRARPRPAPKEGMLTPLVVFYLFGVANGNVLIVT
jgi:hypothetical protein